MKQKDNRTVEAQARRLMERFNNPDGFLFYCQAYHKLSEAKIQELIEIAEAKGKSPARYFYTITRREMEKG
jgi:hypothetical protein